MQTEKETHMADQVYVSQKHRDENIARQMILSQLASQGWTDTVFDSFGPMREYRNGQVLWSGRVTGTPPATNSGPVTIRVERPGSGGWSH
jgi:hypothetical protein